MKPSWIIRAAGVCMLLLGASGAWAGPIGLAFHAATVPGGQSISVPVYADSSLTGAGVTSYQFEFTYSTGALDFLDSAIVTGTMSQLPWVVSVQEISPGRVRVAGAGAAPLSGTGVLVLLRFKTGSSVYTQYPYFAFQSAQLNEGAPAVVTTNASLIITPITLITVSPDVQVLVRGEQQQFTVSGGRAPYVWSSTVPSVASISPAGLMTGLTVGTTRVACSDSAGIADTSGIIEVRGMRVFLRDTSRYQGQTMALPVYVTTLNGLNITSGQLRLAFNTAQWIPQGFIQTGTLTAGMPQFVWQADANGVTVSFGGTTALSGSGILFYLQLRASTATSGYVYCTPQNVLFNETLLAVTQTAYLNIIARPAIAVTPSSAFTLMTGDSVHFVASGGFSPYVWSVTNPATAAIKSDGWLKARRGGTVVVTATDSVGGTGSSGIVSVYDFRLTVPDTTFLGKGTVQYPVRVTANDTGYSSFQFVLSYPTTNFVKLVGIITNGTLSDGWSVFTSPLPATNGNVTFAGASSGARIYSGGVLLFLTFQIPDTAVRPSSMSMTLSGPLFNEGLPKPLLVNGSVALSGTVNVPRTDFVPQGFSLAQNYPNPFNPSTTIMYDVPVRSVVRLTVVNTLGQVVAVLSEGEQESGRHTVSWKPTSGSGVYFARLEATSLDDVRMRNSEVRKMLFLK